MKCSAESLKLPCWVLIVDDDALLADAYERIIERAGGRPISVGSSKDAKMVLLSKSVDVIVLDIRTPKMEGMELLEWVGNSIETKPAIVVLSNHDNIDDISRAYELGADRYVLKAWSTPNDLVRVINESLGRSLQKFHRWQLQY